VTDRDGSSSLMNDDEIGTLDRDLAKHVSYSKRLLPEDPEAVDVCRHFMRDTDPQQSDNKRGLRL
jgi:hypothetical protein